MSADPVNSHGRPDWLSLRTIFLLSAGGYGLLALWFPLIRHVDRTPPGDIRTFAPTPLGGLAYSLLIIGLFALLVAAFRRVEGSNQAKLTLPRLLAGSLVLALPLLLAYPINATDIFGYVIRGRIASAYGESPFTAPAAAFVGDPFMPLVGEFAVYLRKY